MATSFNKYKFIDLGIDILKLILENLNKHNVIQLLKSSKSLYYNPKLRIYVTNRFKKCLHNCENCKFIKYNIKSKYLVILNVESIVKDNKTEIDTCIKFKEHYCNCVVCNNDMFGTIEIVEYNDLLILYETNFTTISYIRYFIESNEFLSFLFEHYINIEYEDKIDDELIKIIESLLINIKKNCAISNNIINGEFDIVL